MSSPELGVSTASDPWMRELEQSVIDQHGITQKQLDAGQRRLDRMRGVEEGYVYLIRSVAGGPIKIGWAKDPQKRLVSLQTAHPYRLTIVAEFPGSRKLERKLHERFAASRIPRGEWFEPTDELLALIPKPVAA